MKHAKCYWGHYVRFFVAMLFLTAFWSLNGSAFAQIPSELKPNPFAEEYVRNQVAKGNLADLREEFPDEVDRVLSASLLEDLLTDSIDGLEVHRKGVRISHAILTEPIDLENAEIPHETRLIDSRFQNGLNLLGSFFRRSVLLDGSSFESKANFNSMKVGGTVFVRNAVFSGAVDFVGADISGDFEANGA